MRYCPRCGGQIRQQARFCDQCGYSLDGPSAARKVRVDYTSSRPQRTSTPEVSDTNPMIAAILALGPGFLGIMGLGHIYVKSRLKGLILLVVGAVLGVLTWVLIFSLFFLSPLDTGPDSGEMVAAVGLFSLIFFPLWLWQAYDAYSIALRMQHSPDMVLPPPYY
ncbi:MAG: hypothetical protein LUQ55_01030 [Methanomassiliicoccales archaeon]|nr:hypothetical protein [Methanomassiliicoccales archaeon]